MSRRTYVHHGCSTMDTTTQAQWISLIAVWTHDTDNVTLRPRIENKESKHFILILSGVIACCIVLMPKAS